MKAIAECKTEPIGISVSAFKIGRSHSYKAQNIKIHKAPIWAILSSTLPCATNFQLHHSEPFCRVSTPRKWKTHFLHQESFFCVTSDAYYTDANWMEAFHVFTFKVLLQHLLVSMIFLIPSLRIVIPKASSCKYFVKKTFYCLQASHSCFPFLQ